VSAYAIRAKTTPRVSVGFSPEDQERLERLAQENDRSVPYVVRQAVRHYLDQMDRGQLTLDLGAADGP
jgi:predicted transcriptional regulator